MRIINFTIPHLKALLLSGQKTQTIRGMPYWINLIRSGKLKISDSVQIWFQQRSPKGERLFYSVINDLRIISDLKSEPEALFIADGFKTKQEALEWFKRVYKSLDIEFALICFAPPVKFKVWLDLPRAGNFPTFMFRNTIDCTPEALNEQIHNALTFIVDTNRLKDYTKPKKRITLEAFLT